MIARILETTLLPLARYKLHEFFCSIPPLSLQQIIINSIAQNKQKKIFRQPVSLDEVEAWIVIVFGDKMAT